jgi:hypothetical protein
LIDALMAEEVAGATLLDIGGSVPSSASCSRLAQRA